MYNDEQIFRKLESIEQMIADQGILQKEMLTIEEASTFLDLTKSYVYKLAHLKVVPTYCPNGKRIYFRRAELEQWLQKNRKASRKEMEAEALSYTTKRRML